MGGKSNADGGDRFQRPQPVDGHVVVTGAIAEPVTSTIERQQRHQHNIGRHFRRIGYGAGYYDMTIAKFRAAKPVVTVGIAYAAQEIADVPVTERDARLDLVLTERDVIDLRGA